MHDARVAIITGGGQGIGRCAVRRFLEKGYRVVIADIDVDAANDAAAECADVGRPCVVPCDVAREEDVAHAVSVALDHYGGIHVLINNAAISANRPVHELSLADWNRVIGVNLTGPLTFAKHCAPHLKEMQGAIINVASTRAFMSEANTEAYSASKGGIYALTHALAASLAPQVRVNCISPGWIETAEWRKRNARETPWHSEMDSKQHWAGRVGKPDDVVALMLYLAGPESGFVTGANFFVDGGMTRKMIYI